MDIKIKRLIFGILIIINCTIIFMFSAQDSEKSSKTSGVVVEKVVDTVVNVNKNVKRETIKEKVSFYVRKTAHFSIYTSLGIWLMCEASTFDISKKKRLLMCALGGLFYAITDEFHQGFVSGRSTEIRDVCIDTSGVLFGCALCLIFIKIGIKIKEYRANERCVSKKM